MSTNKRGEDLVSKYQRTHADDEARKQRIADAKKADKQKDIKAETRGVLEANKFDLETAEVGVHEVTSSFMVKSEATHVEDAVSDDIHLSLTGHDMVTRHTGEPYTNPYALTIQQLLEQLEAERTLRQQREVELAIAETQVSEARIRLRQAERKKVDDLVDRKSDQIQRDNKKVVDELKQELERLRDERDDLEERLRTSKSTIRDLETTIEQSKSSNTSVTRILDNNIPRAQQKVEEEGNRASKGKQSTERSRKRMLARPKGRFALYVCT
ncbi:hypothetical protein LTR66_016046 [Elasticomyces elasticus]|nr:hypothetical protein LTR66_016046 [Elasticomyces elasticus]